MSARAVGLIMMLINKQTLSGIMGMMSAAE
jgi:hypothetical protein